jgi:hypothetical protein
MTARLDAPGVAHHLRGIERRKIFLDENDRRDSIGAPRSLSATGGVTDSAALGSEPFLVATKEKLLIQG